MQATKLDKKPAPKGRQPLAALGKLTLAALIAILAADFFMILKMGPIPMLLVLDLATLIFGGIMLTGARWTPILGAVAGLLAVGRPGGARAGAGFAPNPLRIAPGTRVTWVNLDTYKHNVTAQVMVE